MQNGCKGLYKCALFINKMVRVFVNCGVFLASWTHGRPMRGPTVYFEPTFKIPTPPY